MPKTLPFLPGVRLLGTGSFTGSRMVDNAALEKLVGNYDAASGSFGPWVERVTHIKERRFAAEGETVATMGREAAHRAIEASGVAKEDIDLVLLCSFTYIELYPGDCVEISRAINGRCGAINLSGGCAGSVYGMAMGMAMVKAGHARNVVVIGAEHLTPVTDFDDPITAILFSDGAGAAVIGRREGPAGSGFIDRSVLRHDYAPTNITMSNANMAIPSRIVGKAEGRKHGFAVERQALAMAGGPRVLRNAINAMADVTVGLLGYGLDDLKEGNADLRALLDSAFLVPHQANGRIVDGLQEKLGMPEERVYRTVYLKGNMSSATNMVTLDYAMREGNLRRRERPDGTGDITPCGRRLEAGDLVVLTTIGGGYLYGAVGFRL